MRFIIFFISWTFYNSKNFINGAKTDLALLTTSQVEVWLRAIFQINSSFQVPHIEIIHSGKEIELSLYKNDTHINYKDRHLFKQNINKRVDCFLYENEIQSSRSLNIYDSCHGTLSFKTARKDMAGIYVYTGNQISYGLGILLVETTYSIIWFNGTKIYSFDNQTNIKNGTQLVLGFETMLYYNSNSDLNTYNTRINDIIQQANISIRNDNKTNLALFMSMEDLSCQRHEKIVDNDLRSLTFACIVKVTFKCPLSIGSRCWIENKQLSNIHLNINSHTFISDRTISIQIDV